jgi:hypothetical protein
VTRTWHDVPDPRDETCPAGRRCEVSLEDHRWSHLHEHVSNPDEPWDDWLTPGLAADLRNSMQVGVTEEDRQATRQQVSDQMEQGAKQALGVPLAVLYDVAQPPGSAPGGSRWRLTVDVVLPCGAKLCLREDRHKVLNVLTCFFITAVRSVPDKDQRWRYLVHQLLERYATDNGNGTFSPPNPSAWPRPNPETGEVIFNPRLRTEASWGANGTLPEPWNNLPDYWAPTPPAAPAAAPPPSTGTRHAY